MSSADEQTPDSHPGAGRRLGGARGGATWVIVGILLVGVIGVVAKLGWDQSQATRVVPIPNADRLTPLPGGSRPVAVGRYLLSEDTHSHHYRSLGQHSLIFTKRDPSHWQERVRGPGWETTGDLVCQRGDARLDCVMAFSDAVLEIDTRERDAASVAKLTQQYLAGLRDEPWPVDWLGTPPPNVNRLRPLAEAGDRMPESVGGVPRTLATGATTDVWWRVQYGPEESGLDYRVFKDQAIWGYLTAGTATAYGDVMCRTADQTVSCFAAGSDGIVLGWARDQDPAVVAAPLQELVK